MGDATRQVAAAMSDAPSIAAEHPSQMLRAASMPQRMRDVSDPAIASTAASTATMSPTLMAALAQLQATLLDLLARTAEMPHPAVTMSERTRHLWPDMDANSSAQDACTDAVVASTDAAGVDSPMSGRPTTTTLALDAIHAAEHAERALRPALKAQRLIATNLQAALTALADYPQLLLAATPAYEAATRKATAAGLSSLPVVSILSSAPSSSPSSRRTSGHAVLPLRMPPRLPSAVSAAVSPSPSPAHHRRTTSHGILSPGRAARIAMGQEELVLPGSLLPVPLSLAPRSDECVFCPDLVHRHDVSAGKTHSSQRQEYLDREEEWTMASIQSALELPSDSEETMGSFKRGIQLAAASELPSNSSPPLSPISPTSNSVPTLTPVCALIGISLTSFFDEAHLVETILFCARRFQFVRFVVISDPYISSQTQKQLQKAGAWGVGLPVVEALKQFDLLKTRAVAQKLIIQKFRIVRRAVETLCNEKLAVSVADIPVRLAQPTANFSSPRFAWIQWADVIQLPLYQQTREAIGNLFQTSELFRTEVMSVAHHPVDPPTASGTIAERASDARLSVAEVNLFADYFLSEHAFLACLPTWLQCPGDRIFMPYHCNSRALPFIVSPQHFNPVELGLVQPEYSHAEIGMAVLPTASSLRRGECPSASSTPFYDVCSPTADSSALPSPRLPQPSSQQLIQHAPSAPMAMPRPQRLVRSVVPSPND